MFFQIIVLQIPLTIFGVKMKCYIPYFPIKAFFFYLHLHWKWKSSHNHLKKFPKSESLSPPLLKKKFCFFFYIISCFMFMLLINVLIVLDFYFFLVTSGCYWPIFWNVCTSRNYSGNRTLKIDHPTCAPITTSWFKVKRSPVHVITS